jgi:hypothetical protein
MPSVLTAVWSWMRPGRTVPAHRVRPWPSLTTVGLRVFCLRLPEMNARRRVGRRGAGGPGSRCRRCAARTGRQQAARSCPRPRPGRRPTRRRAPGCRAGAPSCLGPAGWPRQRWWVSPADRSRRFRRSQRPAGHRCIAPSRAKAQGLPCGEACDTAGCATLIWTRVVDAVCGGGAKGIAEPTGFGHERQLDRRGGVLQTLSL